jgi:hypothetical protein
MPATVSAEELIRLNPGIWLETHGYVRDVNGRKSRPVLNILQRRMNALYMARLMAGKSMRGIVVKPRKRGASTMVSAHHYAQLMNWPHEGFIIGDRSETTGIVFRMLKFYADTDEFVGQWGSPIKSATTEEIVWHHGAMVTQGTAQGRASARGRTPQFVHETEKAHWEKPEETSDAVLNAVPDEGFTVIWEESTPFGSANLFAKTFGDARWPRVEECPDGFLYWRQWASLVPDQEDEGRSDLDYCRVFAAWYEFDTPGAKSYVRLDEDGRKQMQDTIDAEGWYRGERELIRRYGNEGPRGMRLGQIVTECDVWEQLAWRRATIKNKCRKSLDVFNSEHPSDPKTCFVSSGHSVFDSESLDRIWLRTERARTQHVQIEVRESPSGGNRRAQVNPSDSEMSTIHLWEHPRFGCRYLMPVDLSEGKDQTKTGNPDANSALILRDAYADQSGLLSPMAVVARVRPPNHMPLPEFARITSALGLYFGNCMQIPEMNNSGLAYITALRLLFPWVPIWQRAERDPITGQVVKEMYGWRTTDISGYGGIRTQIIAHLQDVLRENAIDIPCPHIHRELTNFVNKEGRMEAGAGKDDDVLALAIGVYNISSGTIYSEAMVPRSLPRDLEGLARQSAHVGGLSMRY